MACILLIFSYTVNYWQFGSALVTISTFKGLLRNLFMSGFLSPFLKLGTLNTYLRPFSVWRNEWIWTFLFYFLRYHGNRVAAFLFLLYPRTCLHKMSNFMLANCQNSPKSLRHFIAVWLFIYLKVEEEEGTVKRVLLLLLLFLRLQGHLFGWKSGGKTKICHK